MRQGAFEEVSIWQNVAYAERELFSDRQFPTLTVRQTEPGSPISARLEQSLTAHLRPLLFAPVACVPARLTERNFIRQNKADKALPFQKGA